jgi:hypothetical protein
MKLVGVLCRLRGEDVFTINSKATVSDKIKALAEALKHFYLDRIYMLPAVRDFLERIPE